MIGNKLKLGKLCYYVNLFGTIYFAQLILLSYLNIDTQFTSFIRELFTIPVLMLGIPLIILSIKAFKSDKYSLRSYSFGAIIVTTLNILALILATLFNV